MSNRKDSTKKGPPLGQEIPTQPWKKLATDLFTYDRANYLLVVDYTTKFPVVRKLTDLTAHVVTDSVSLALHIQLCQTMDHAMQHNILLMLWLNGV